jgi:hypothetical protein
MPNARSLREIVTAVRAKVWKARDAGPPVTAEMEQDTAPAEGRATRPEQVTRRLGERG